MRRASILAASLALCCGACSEPAPPAGPPDGAALFREQNCIACHAADGSGTTLAPGLRGKQALWTREQLAEYIEDSPAYVARDERLKAQAAHYTIPMTTFPGLTLGQRLALADYVLTLR